MTRIRTVTTATFFPAARPADASPQDWPYHLDQCQHAWLDRLRDAWGEDVVIQIYSGRVRIRDDDGDHVFYSATDLEAATARRRCESRG